jgi:CRP-like cAMP-binding protein
MVRLREFRHGAMIGEMAAYSTLRSRSASAIVTEAAVVYKLIPEKIELLGAHASQYSAILHEMVARLLASRLSAMNRNVELNA